MKVSPEELLEEWESGEKTGMRPQRVQYLREEFMEYTSRYFPHRIHELEGFLDRLKGSITQDLREAVEEYESTNESE